MLAAQYLAPSDRVGAFALCVLTKIRLRRKQRSGRGSTNSELHCWSLSTLVQQRSIMSVVWPGMTAIQRLLVCSKAGVSVTHVLMPGAELARVLLRKQLSSL